MYRNVIEQLKEWKNSPQRKPLVLAEARQVGKTYILKEFGKTEYENVVFAYKVVGSSQGILPPFLPCLWSTLLLGPSYTSREVANHCIPPNVDALVLVALYGNGNSQFHISGYSRIFKALM
jgi:hypothetical protein